MEIDVKYKLYARVWVMLENKPTEISLTALRVDCMYEGYTAEKWGDSYSNKGGYPFRIMYNTECYGKSQWHPQYTLFPTKEELLKSL